MECEFLENAQKTHFKLFRDPLGFMAFTYLFVFQLIIISKKSDVNRIANRYLPVFKKLGYASNYDPCIVSRGTIPHENIFTPRYLTKA